jgi:acetyl-CoA acyltransferase
MPREAVIVGAVRTAVGRSKKGITRDVRPDDLAAAVIRELLRRSEDRLDPAQVDDVVLGCAYPEGAQGLNAARPVAILAGLPVEVPAQTINRFCSSGLQAVAIASERIIANGADIIVAGGMESMSSVPMTGHHLSLNPWLVENHPEVYMSMGLTAERVAEVRSHGKPGRIPAATTSPPQRGFKQVRGESFPSSSEVRLGRGSLVRERHILKQDEHLRRETCMEGLSKLKPVFKQGGSVTAGNSSPLSDGAAALLVMEAGTAARLGLQPLARFVGFNVAGVRPEIMGVGPVRAVPRVLDRTGLRLGDIDLIELNEAFASQSVAVIRELEFDPAIVNVNGGAIALGHPLGCTGAKLTTQILYELKRRKARYGMVTMCIGGGMGAAGIFENLN